jgi:Response regulator containing CheY-like receiver, AAA-type ATPase, and DNA-binding domains
MVYIVARQQLCTSERQTTVGGRCARVLVIDADEGRGSMITAFLRRSVACEPTWTSGSDVDVAPDGAFELVVISVSLFARDAAVAVAATKTRQPTCEVIIVDAQPSVESAQLAIRLGASGYCTYSSKGESQALAQSARLMLAARPSRRAPGFHRELLIEFFAKRILPAGHGYSESLLPRGRALQYLVKLLFDSIAGFRPRLRRASEGSGYDLECLNTAIEPFWSTPGPSSHHRV